jgi:proline racemase
MNVTETLSQFIVDVNYDKLPTSVVEAAKVAILDGVANMLAGSAQELATIIGQYVKESGGTPQSTVIGWGFKANAPSAAFANGVFGHCLDYEIQGFPPTHGTSSCLPAALALGEMRNSPGKTIIAAYVLGWEVQGRLRAASVAASNPAFHPPGMVGPLEGPPPAPKSWASTRIRPRWLWASLLLGLVALPLILALWSSLLIQVTLLAWALKLFRQ